MAYKELRIDIAIQLVQDLTLAHCFVAVEDIRLLSKSSKRIATANSFIAAESSATNAKEMSLMMFATEWSTLIISTM